MRDTCLPPFPATVPVADIARSRRDFPQAQLSFHLELDCDGLAGLAALCGIFARAGLQLKTLRATETGAVHCILLDSASPDLTRLAAELAQVAVLNRWVTQIGF